MLATAAVYDGLLAAVGTNFVGGGAVLDVAAQGAGHTVFPGRDGVLVKGQLGDKVNNVRNRHSVSQDAGNQFSVVPIFLFEGA